MKLTEKDLLRIQEALNEAEKDDTPVMIVSDNGDMSVVGDPNKTVIKHYDYTVEFRVPAQISHLLPDAKPFVGGKYAVASVEYKDVMITARDDLRIISALVAMRPFLVEILPSGESVNRSVEELGQIAMSQLTNKAVLDAMYNFVGTVIGVDEKLIPMMMYNNVLENTLKIFSDFPEILNESDFFTGPLSSGTETQMRQ